MVTQHLLTRRICTNHGQPIKIAGTRRAPMPMQVGQIPQGLRPRRLLDDRTKPVPLHALHFLSHTYMGTCRNRPVRNPSSDCPEDWPVPLN